MSTPNLRLALRRGKDNVMQMEWGMVLRVVVVVVAILNTQKCTIIQTQSHFNREFHSLKSSRDVCTDALSLSQYAHLAGINLNWKSGTVYVYLAIWIILATDTIMIIMKRLRTGRWRQLRTQTIVLNTNVWQCELYTLNNISSMSLFVIMVVNIEVRLSTS